MPLGILPSSMCSVKEISTKNSVTSNNLENLDVNDVLEIIKILLNYIKKRRVEEPPPSRLHSLQNGGLYAQLVEKF